MDTHLKTAKGTRDYSGEDKIELDSIIEETEEIYKSRGGVPFDTPIFELKSVLTNKYGEDSKLIYDLADQGGELCALRYDLTVPFARYLAQTKTLKIKRYHTGKVFRRDQPTLSKGRYREFFQSDFDIVGEYESMCADAEVISTGCEILKHFSKKLGNKQFTVRINHKKLVDAVMKVCEIPPAIQKTIGSSIDKLDKMSWEDIAKEMKEKGAKEESIGMLKEHIHLKGDLSLIRKLKELDMGITDEGKEALADLEKLYELLVIYGVDQYIVVDLSLIRGLDYYTGILIEGEFEGCCGSVLAGGRYDNLVKNLLESQDLSSKAKKQSKDVMSVKCVGVSLGVSRLFSAITPHGKKTHTEVVVCSVGPGLLKVRLQLCVYLRENGIKTEYFMGTSGNFARHSEYADSIGVKTMVLIGRKEIENEEYQIVWGEKNNREKKTVKKDTLISSLKDVIRMVHSSSINTASPPLIML